MSRLITSDATMTNPLALLTMDKLSALTDLVAPVPEYLKSSGDATLSIVENCVVAIGPALFRTQSATIGVSNLDTGAFAAGKDYYVYICDDGTDTEKYLISLNSTFPSGYNATNSRKIGGFHYGQCRRVDAMLRPVNSSNAAYGTGWEGNVYVGIVPRSVWTLKHRPKCSPEGMTYAGAGLWVDIYLSSDDGNGGVKSAFGGTPLTGTEGHNWYSFVDRALMAGKKLPSYGEWLKAAYGSPQGNDGDNVNAWTATTNTGRNPTGAVANAVSSIGCRDCVGDVWEWLDDLITNASGHVLSGTTSPTSYTYASYDGGRAGKVQTTGTGHGPATRGDSGAPVQGAWGWDKDSPLGDTTGGNLNNGNIYEYYDQSLIALHAGGHWTNGARAGSRAVYLSLWAWYVIAILGARCACESL